MAKQKANEDLDEIVYEAVRYPRRLQNAIFDEAHKREGKTKKRVSKNTVIVEALMEKFLPTK